MDAFAALLRRSHRIEACRDVFLDAIDAQVDSAPNERAELPVGSTA